jgi:two-component system, sporulation sensor kinase E
MSRFVKKALEKAPRIDKSQLESLLALVVAEHELYEASLHSLPSGFVVLDPTHRVIFHNKAAERLVPFVPGFEGSDKAVWTQLRDADVAAFLRQSLETDQTSLTREFAFDSATGPRILSFALMPLVLEGRIQGSMLLVQDMTERKSRESRLRRAESLASLTTLAAGVAHEIKNSARSRRASPSTRPRWAATSKSSMKRSTGSMALSSIFCSPSVPWTPPSSWPA